MIKGRVRGGKWVRLWEKERGGIFQTYCDLAEGCDTVRAIISDHGLSLLRSLIRQGRGNRLGWIMANNLHQSMDTAEHDFLFSMGYHINMKCFSELPSNCFGARWRQNNLSKLHEEAFEALRLRKMDSLVCLCFILVSLKGETQDHTPELFQLNCRFRLSAKYPYLTLFN